MLCRIARTIVADIKWLWVVPIATFIVTFIANIAPTPIHDFANGFRASVLGWLFIGPYALYTYLGLGLLIIVPLAAWIVTRALGCEDKDKSQGNISLAQHNESNTGTIQQGKDSTMIGPGSTVIESVGTVYIVGTPTSQALIQKGQSHGDRTSGQLDGVVVLATDGNLVQSNREPGLPLPFDPRWLKMLKAPGGAVQLESPFYIERQIDNDAKEAILREGETLRVKGSQQVGKTSLLARLYKHTKDHGYPALYIDFESTDNNDFRDLEALLFWLANKIANSQKTHENPNTYWSGALGSKDKLTDFLSKEVLSNHAKPFVLLIDKVDRIFAFKQYKDDFFSLIRFWHNARAFDDIWDKLNVVLAYSTEAFLFIEDMDQSPFNIGTEVTVADFKRMQVEELNQRHGEPVKTTHEMDIMMEILGGHPFLVQKALYDLVSQKLDAEDYFKTAYNDDGPFSHHLHDYLRYLHEQPDLSRAMKLVIHDHACSTDELFYKLASSGLVSGSDRHNVQPRCTLYAEYFKNHL